MLASLLDHKIPIIDVAIREKKDALLLAGFVFCLGSFKGLKDLCATKIVVEIFYLFDCCIFVFVIVVEHFTLFEGTEM